MNSEKEEQLTKNVGIISAITLVLLLAGVSYFLVLNQQTENVVEIVTIPLEQPIQSRKTNSSENELLYAAAQLARSIEGGDSLSIGAPLDGSPGVYVVDVVSQTEDGAFTVDAYGKAQPTGNDIGPVDLGVILTK